MYWKVTIKVNHVFSINQFRFLQCPTALSSKDYGWLHWRKLSRKVGLCPGNLWEMTLKRDGFSVANGISVIGELTVKVTQRSTDGIPFLPVVCSNM